VLLVLVLVLVLAPGLVKVRVMKTHHRRTVCITKRTNRALPPISHNKLTHGN
jgi:hypothetical protein